MPRPRRYGATAGAGEVTRRSGEVTLAPGSGFIFIERQQLELPAGPAERVDFAANEEGGRWSVYVAWNDGYVHELWCRGDELPRPPKEKGSRDLRSRLP